MKGIYLTLFVLFISMRLAAQVPVGTGQPVESVVQQRPALEFREVSGIVKDEKDDPVPGATVLLKSPLDSVTTTTNANGIFIFTKVKRAGFYITVSGQGILTTTKLYRNNDMAKQIVLNPIELIPPKPTELKEVVINGKPTIIYKQDTVEYKASDYKVREGDTLDELLRKMEGFDVGKDGTLLYQGQKVTKGRLNGKNFLGGDVGQMIQNLPAAIIEKAQVIDDYGDQAARTGIKDHEPDKLLNVTTKPDRSIGTYVNTLAQGGNNDRYNANLTLTHINANRQVGLVGNVNNTVNGVSTGTSGGGGAGTTRSGNPVISYSDEWGKTKVTASYNYGFNDNTSINKSFGQTYSYGQSASVKNTSNFSSESNAENHQKSHRVAIDISKDMGKWDYIKITPTFNYSNGNNSTNALTDNLNNFVTGFEHPVVNSISTNLTETKNYSLTALYQHTFKKPRQNFSVQLGTTRTNNNANGEKYTDYRYFADSTQNNLIRDSVAHLLTKRLNTTTGYNTSVTFTEPVGKIAQFEFTGRLNRTVYDNKATSDTVLANGRQIELTRLSNIFNYAFTESRLTFNYSYPGKKVTFSIGGSVIPSALSGTRVNNNTNQDVSASLNSFRVIPVLRFTYIWSTTERLNLTYTGNNNIPDFQQIQPFTDRSDPNNIITGNPHLIPAFNNVVSLSYNNYIANSKENISVSINGINYQDQVVTNVIQHPELISTSPVRYRTVYETTYVNLNGSNQLNGNYSFSKQLNDKKYTLAFTGQIGYGYNVAMSNNVLYHNTRWHLNERFGPQINPTTDISINPYIAYDVARTFTSLPGAPVTNLQTTSLAIDSRFYFFNSWQTTFSASKNFVTGLGNLNTNPLVINATIQKQIFKKNNIRLTLSGYDLLHQNNFIQQTVTPQGVTNTLSNTQSRYFLIGFSATFQKWGGRPKRGGKDLNRKGDGSFIY